MVDGGKLLVLMLLAVVDQWREGDLAVWGGEDDGGAILAPQPGVLIHLF